MKIRGHELVSSLSSSETSCTFGERRMSKVSVDRLGTVGKGGVGPQGPLLAGSMVAVYSLG